MLTLDEIKKRLEPMNLQRVAKETGLHPNVLYRISAGGEGARYETVKRISDWLEAQ